MPIPRQVVFRGAQLAGLAAALLVVVAASGPWTVVATRGSAGRPLWEVGAMAVAGVVLVVAGALAAGAGFGPRRGDAEAAGLAVLAAGGSVFGTGLAFLALTRSGSRLDLPTTIRIQPVSPGILVGESTFPVAGRLLVVATGTVVVLAAFLALRARNVTRPDGPSARSTVTVPAPVGAAVAAVGAGAVLVGASVLPWRSTSGSATVTLWSSGAPVAAGAVLVLAAGLGAAALLQVRPRRSASSALGVLVLTLAGAVGGALLVADRLPGIRPGSPYRDLLLQESTSPLELLAAVVAVFGGTTLVVGACLALFSAAAAPERERADLTG